MGRIADAVLSLLADGPAGADEVGRLLESNGVTRSRDPAAAVRRAIRDDPRVIQLVDGRLASLSQVLGGVELTTVVTEEQAAAGRLDLEPDLAPLAMLGLAAGVPLPPGVRPGQMLAVRVEDPARRDVSVRCIAAASPRPQDEAALLAAVEARLRPLPAGPSVGRPARHPSRCGGRADRGLRRRAARPRPPPVGRAGGGRLRGPSRLDRPSRDGVGQPDRGGGGRPRGGRRRPAGRRAARGGRARPGPPADRAAAAPARAGPAGAPAAGARAGARRPLRPTRWRSCAGPSPRTTPRTATRPP